MFPICVPASHWLGLLTLTGVADETLVTEHRGVSRISVWGALGGIMGEGGHLLSTLYLGDADGDCRRVKSPTSP